MSTRNLTVEEILAGTRHGRTQSVGQMSVIPILDDAGVQDDDFAPPDFEVYSPDYGTVEVRNRSDRPTIVPTGAGWVTKEQAQDHAVAGAALVPAKSTCDIETAMCIQESQGGHIRDQEKITMLVLPAALRAIALSKRYERGYSKLWEDIGSFNRKAGVSGHGSHGHLEFFLQHYEKELDEFVAEFELVPDQIGAVVMLGDSVVGIERAPNVDYWKHVWEPLIRVCYGSLAIVAQQKDRKPPKHRVPLNVQVASLAGIARALKEATQEVKQLVGKTIDQVAKTPLLYAGDVDQSVGEMQVMTVANKRLSGQIVTKAEAYPYVSLCTA
jgi:hypothetical protein